MDNEKNDVIDRLNWLSGYFANKKKLWVKRSKKDFADKAFSICTDALGLLIEQRAEIERLEKENRTLKLTIQSMPNWLNEKRPEVVRCKDCEWHEMRGEMLLCKVQDKPHTYDWFCADAKRKDGELNG